MIKAWLIGFLSERLVRQHVRAASSITSLAARKRIARHVLNAMVDAKRTERLTPDAYADYLRREKIKAQKMRYSALGVGAASRNDPRWHAAALLEEWLAANLEARTGRLSRDRCLQVDAMIMRFIQDTMGKQRVTHEGGRLV